METDKRTLEILIAMGMKPDAVNKTVAEFKRINEQIDVLEKNSKDLREAIEVALDHGEDANELKAQLKVAENAVESLKRKFNSAGDSAQKAFNLRDIGEKLGRIGMGMQQAGNMLLAPLQGALQAYMAQQQAIKDAGGTMSESAKKYQDAQKQMQEAYIRIGAVAADKLLPVMETAADLVDKFADFIEKNPTLVTAIAGLGVGLTAVGTVVSAVGQMAMIAGTLQGLGVGGTAAAGATAGGAALGTTAATAGSAALLIAAPIVGAIIAKYVGNAFQRAMGQEESSWSDIGNTAKQAVMLPSKLALLGLVETGIVSEETGTKLNKFQNELFNVGDAAKEAAPATEKTTEELLAEAEAAKKAADASAQIAKAYAQYQTETAEAQRSFEISKTKLAEEARRTELEAERTHNQALVSINARYKDQIESATASYRQAEAKSASDYQTARAQAIRDGGEEIRKIERDHQKRLAELAQGHNERMGDLVANRDALGIVKENQAYEKSRKDEEQNTNAEIAQRRRDIAVKLQDMAQAYAAERKQRAQELQQKLADAAKQKQAELKAEREQYAESVRKNRENNQLKLKELTQQFNEEARRRRNGFLASVNDLAAEANIKNKYHALMLKDVEAFMAKYRASLARTSNSPGRAGGGYASLGVYQMGEKGTEFVLNADTTRAAEKMIGGNITQDRMLSGLARGSSQSVSNQITLQQTVHFNGENSAVNRAQLRTLIHAAALEAVENVMVRS